MEVENVRWRDRFPSNGVDPVKAYKEILRLKAQNKNSVSPELLVESARDESSTLHPLFNWDDAEAASKYRVQQASTILRAIEVVYIEGPKKPSRAFEIVQNKRRGDTKTVTLYATAEEACADPDVHARLVAEAVRGLIAWRNRYQTLNEMRQLVRIIDKVVDELAV
jgi:tRNA A37 N6-isopentenylltransferase MiaA